jgi:hypothetical protein
VRYDVATEPAATLRELEVPDGAIAIFESLPADDQERFAETVAAAAAADTARVEKALEATMKLVPAPLRPRARALLFPGDAS